VNGTEATFAAGWRLVRTLPEPVGRALFTAGADLQVRRDNQPVRRLRQNLRRVVGPDLPDADLDDLVRRGMRSYLRYYYELFRLPAMSRDRIVRAFHVADEPRVHEVMNNGRGAILALPHSGNWDLAGAWLAVQGHPLVAIAERLKPEGLFRRFVAVRERIGIEVIPLTGGDRPPMDALAERLDKGYAVALLADRDLPGRGVAVDFFGGRTTMPPGPALLALRTGAPLFAVDMWYEREAAWGRLNSPLELPPPDAGPLTERIRMVTQDLADRMAAGIARHPEDWHMLQRMWREPARTGDRGQ
jgi:phosphatidylinositol dimannoside acyltransferase